MYKKIGLSILGILFCTLVSSCTYVKSPEELVRRPKSTTRENETYNIVSSFLDQDKTLTLATSQMDEEAVRSVDIDGDGKSEIVILYKKLYNEHKGYEQYGILILKKKKETWYEINRITRPTHGFDFVQYGDITGDNKPEIFIGSNTVTEVDKRLEVYSYHDGYFRGLYYSDYRNFGLKDLDQDGKAEIIIFNKKGDSDTKYLEVLKYRDNKIVVLDQYDINNKSYYSDMTVGKVSKDHMGILMDYDTGALNGTTDLLILRDNKLIQVLRNTNRNITGSMDINNDGIIEFGFVGRVRRALDQESYEIPYIKEWYQWSGQRDINLVQREYYSYDNGYKIVIPMVWENEFTIIEKADDNKVEFYFLNDIGDQKSQIFYIQSFNKEDWIKEKLGLEHSDYIVLSEDREQIILGVIIYKDEESKYYINKEKLREIFLII